MLPIVVHLALFFSFLQKLAEPDLVNSSVVTELGVERGAHHVALLDSHNELLGGIRGILNLSQNLDVVVESLENYRSSNENGVENSLLVGDCRGDSKVAKLERGDEGAQLSAKVVSRHHHVQASKESRNGLVSDLVSVCVNLGGAGQSLLLGLVVVDTGGDENQTSTGAPGGFLVHSDKLSQSIQHTGGSLGHQRNGGGLASGNHQTLALLQLGGGSDLDNLNILVELGSGLFEMSTVLGESSLKSKHTNGLSLGHGCVDVCVCGGKKRGGVGDGKAHGIYAIFLPYIFLPQNYPDSYLPNSDLLRVNLRGGVDGIVGGIFGVLTYNIIAPSQII